ncbi:MAG TPA: DUF1592 domain-containing protein [Opitutaceae bacterium]|nr:DUF1592 domain-containing protein [Opitutaceae bacterium]
MVRGSQIKFRRSVRTAFVVAGLGWGGAATAAEPDLAAFRREIQPVLERYCYDCHGDGKDKGGIALDGFESAGQLRDHKLWLRALKNVRAGIMPPAEEEQPSAAEAEKLVQWMKREGLGLDPAAPDPGRVTVRRLNRVEYRNTVRELTGVDYDTQKEFPADDAGHGFDNIADVLTISPILLEKYLDAAQVVIAKAVPTQSRVVAETAIAGRKFAVTKIDTTLPAALAEEAAKDAAPPANQGQRRAARDSDAPRPNGRPVPGIAGESLDLCYYTPVTVTATHRVEHAGTYQLVADLRSIESYVDNVFDLNRCRLVIAADGDTLLDQEFVREGDRKYEFTFERAWSAGDHTLTFEIRPLAPERPQIRFLRLRVNAVTVRGPLAPEHWVKPANYDSYFPRDVPAGLTERRAYARELLGKFASRAFRRPADADTVQRLSDLAERVSSQGKNSFETGIAQAMVAVLASPRFIFREEETEPLQAGETYPRVDEYALASRLSYFFWSSMPDEELFRLAREGRLRADLPAQVDRLLKDPRSREFVRNFPGQWLQARDIIDVPITATDVFLRENPNPAFEEARATFLRLVTVLPEKRTAEDAAAFDRARGVFRDFNRQRKPQLSDELRAAMLQETEMTFAHVLKEDRSLLELIESDYTFLNEDLAKHYGIENVMGGNMRKVTLPAGSPRGGVLTQGTVLAVTSNPTRTSPVKRGVLILDAILGTPPAPPPPNIPSLEDAAPAAELKKMSLRETLALHAENPACHSCHSRMDPLGLALENFNAMGAWRSSEMGQPIQTAGKLITGESFADVRELKRILATSRRRDFYTCISEKMLTYALGRGMEYYDVDTLDRLVARLESSGGRPSALLRGIVESAPFQQSRRPVNSPPVGRDHRLSERSR